MRVCEGTVKRVWFRWRWGVGDLAGSRVFYHEFQIWPLSLDQWLPSFHAPVELPESYPVLTEPHDLVIETYNTDDTFDHALWFAVEIEREVVQLDPMSQVLELLRLLGYA